MPSGGRIVRCTVRPSTELATLNPHEEQKGGRPSKTMLEPPAATWLELSLAGTVM